MTPSRSAGFFLVAAGAMVTAAGFLKGLPNPSNIREGWLSVFLLFDQGLALLGLGCAMGQVSRRTGIFYFLLFIGAATAGLALSEELLALTLIPSPWGNFVLPQGALGCVLAGGALLAPKAWRVWLMPPVSVLSGLCLALTAVLILPGDEEWWWFALAMLGSGMWIVFTAAFLWRQFEKPWFGIAGRILASWLITIGILLGGAQISHKPLVQNYLQANPKPSLDKI